MVKMSRPLSRSLRDAIMLVLVALAVSAVSACAPKSANFENRSEQDPLTTVRVLIDALNTRQLSVASGVLAEDVVFIDSRGETQTGKASLNNWMQARSAEPSELCDIWLSGEKIAWTERMGDRGNSRLVKNEAVVRGGKIKSLKWIENLE